MSLRKPRGEEWEKEISPEKFAEGIRKAHTLVQCGTRGWRCLCSKVYSSAKNRQDAQVCHHVHQNAVVELMTDQQNGRSNYDEP